MRNLIWYCVAAIGEIGGCFAFWAWLRLGKSALWMGPGTASLILFAIALTQVNSAFAGRAYAAYGGVYVVASLLFLWGIEKTRPDTWDLIGAGICLAGTAIILGVPRHA